jgi:putative heme transporter
MVAVVRRAGHVLAVTISLVLAGVLVVVVLPRTTGFGWDSASDEVAGIPLWQLAELVLVWLAGLWAHTYVLRSALPGLSRRRAFALNLGGSSVSNVLPFGGAAGIGLNYAMLRSWGYDGVQITAYTTVTNVLVAVVKFAIAMVGVVALLNMPTVASHLSRPHTSTSMTVAAVVVVLLAIGLVVLLRWWRSSLRSRVVETIGHVRAQCGLVLRHGWATLAVGGIGYPLLQVVLLQLCLDALGVSVGFGAVLAAYAVERLATLIPLTPGGVGVVETVATGVLVGFGADPATAAAGVVLFRIFSFVIEIPVGALIAAAWFARTSRRRGVTGRASALAA